MVQSRGGLRLLLKAPETVGILRHKERQDLDRDFPLQNRIAGAIHLAHSASTQEAENFIAIQLCSGTQGHGGLIINVALGPEMHSSEAAFSIAFKRWAGLSPSGYRRTMLDAAP